MVGGETPIYMTTHLPPAHAVLLSCCRLPMWIRCCIRLLVRPMNNLSFCHFKKPLLRFKIIHSGYQSGPSRGRPCEYDQQCVCVQGELYSINRMIWSFMSVGLKINTQIDQCSIPIFSHFAPTRLIASDCCKPTDDTRSHILQKASVIYMTRVDLPMSKVQVIVLEVNVVSKEWILQLFTCTNCHDHVLLTTTSPRDISTDRIISISWSLVHVGNTIPNSFAVISNYTCHLNRSHLQYKIEDPGCKLNHRYYPRFR